MEWKGLNGKKIFIKLRTGDVYNGDVIDVDDNSKPLIFITLIDKYNKKITIVHSEIIKLEEQE